MQTETITVRTGGQATVRDITGEAQEFARGNEDLITALDQVLPPDDRWRHRHGSRGHGRDHLVPAFVTPFATLPVIDGRIALGTWQSICLVDPNADNSTRQVRFSFLPA
jgi:thiamine phosphate synthase YjbQ (UPF0047 family)